MGARGTRPASGAAHALPIHATVSPDTTVCTYGTSGSTGACARPRLADAAATAASGATGRATDAHPAGALGARGTRPAGGAARTHSVHAAVGQRGITAHTRGPANPTGCGARCSHTYITVAAASGTTARVADAGAHETLGARGTRPAGGAAHAQPVHATVGPGTTVYTYGTSGSAGARARPRLADAAATAASGATGRVTYAHPADAMRTHGAITTTPACTASVDTRFPTRADMPARPAVVGITADVGLATVGAFVIVTVSEARIAGTVTDTVSTTRCDVIG